MTETAGALAHGRDDARWAAVIVHYEAGPLLVDCVRSVLADGSAGPIELVVVDNGSRDDSIADLHAAFPQVRVVHAPANVGYARGANLGIAATYAPIVAVLNPDLTVMPGTAGALVARIEHEPRIGAVGPRVRNTDRSDYPSARQDSLGAHRRRPRRARTVLAHEPVHGALPPARYRPGRRA